MRDLQPIVVLYVSLGKYFLRVNRTGIVTMTCWIRGTDNYLIENCLQLKLFMLGLIIDKLKFCLWQAFIVFISPCQNYFMICTYREAGSLISERNNVRNALTETYTKKVTPVRYNFQRKLHNNSPPAEYRISKTSFNDETQTQMA